ncbi:MAG: XRE family transcriptional regulator [Firmicutes bacterium HGW-Firmicutes-1]|jgi:transcriptional regulator with XRE-family HTH domain|nr:MAG: XRE family transcriptional regulator [Firmicutes bacterium HGW-Firmicutes-1]
MNNYFLSQKTPKEIDEGIALRIRSIRKAMKLTQEKLSEKSGVSLGSVKRFEHTGEISLSSLTKIAIAMECENDLESLFSERPFKSIQEVIDGQN